MEFTFTKYFAYDKKTDGTVCRIDTFNDFYFAILMNNCSYLSRVLSKKMSFFYKYFEIAIWSNVNQTLGSALGMLRVETSSAYNFCYETFCSDC